MSRLMLAADLHLGHKNITKYRTQFSSAEEHHETILDNIKSSVNKADSLWLLGDIAFDKHWLSRVSEIKCRRKVLILGNHDTDRSIKIRDLVEVYDEVHSLVSHRNIWFSHCPIHPQELRNRDFNIHGHLHGDIVKLYDSNYMDKHYINVSIEHTGFKAVSFEEVINNHKERIK